MNRTEPEVWRRLTDPDVPRTRYGSPLWPKDDRQAWFMLCDLARVAPDNTWTVDQLHEALRAHGEKTHRSTVARLVEASR